VGSQAAEKIRTVTSILNGETNHAFDSTEVDGAGFHGEPEKRDLQQTHGYRGAVRGKEHAPLHLGQHRRDLRPCMEHRRAGQK